MAMSLINFSSFDWNVNPTSKIKFNKFDPSTIDWKQLDPSRIDWNNADISKINWNQLDSLKINWDQIDPNSIDWSNADVSKINWEQINPSKVTDYIERRSSAIISKVEDIVNNLKKAWWYQKLQNFAMDLFMKQPSIIQIGTQYGGEPIYYVNGICTTKDRAKDAATDLSDRLQRPVFIIYNPTENLVVDVAEATYDRLWTYAILNLLEKLAEITINVFLGREPKLQQNETTREVSYLLYHAKSSISILSHSQGCLIVRNACFTLFLLGQESWVRSKLAWVAAAPPFNDMEVYPSANKHTTLRNAKDPVTQMLAVNSSLNTVKQWTVATTLPYSAPIAQNVIDIEAHDLIKNYIPHITNDMFWSLGERMDQSTLISVRCCMMH
jgi:hypothetical protein